MNGFRAATRDSQHRFPGLRDFRGVAHIVGTAMEPSGCRVVVVRSGITDGVFPDLIQPKIRIGHGKLQNDHSRDVMLISQRFHCRRNDAEIFGNDRKSAHAISHRIENSAARTGLPCPRLGGRGVGGNGPISFEPAKVVDPYNIDELGGRFEPVDPPSVTAAGVHLPIVERVAPKLPILAEIVGRHAGDGLRMAIPIDPQDLRMCPRIRAVQRNVDWHVAEQADAVCLRIGTQSTPLLKEQELNDLDMGDLVRGRFFEFCKRGRITPRVDWRPGRPGLLVVAGFQDAIQGVVV